MSQCPRVRRLGVLGPGLRLHSALEGDLLCQGAEDLHYRPFQVAASSEHPLVVVSTTQLDDCDESSSFLIKRLL